MSFSFLYDFIFANASDVSEPDEAPSERVKAGIFYFDGYHTKDGDGKLTGYDKSWNDMFAMLENGEIDMITSARKNPECEAKFAFWYPIRRNSTILSVFADNTKYHSEEYGTYDGMCIGLLVGSSQNDLLAEFVEDKQFSYDTKEYENSQDLAMALEDGSIDAIFSSNLRKMDNVRTLDALKTENFYVIVRKEDKELLAEINYIIEQMDINGGDWTSSLFFKYYGPVYSPGLVFTEREKAYIQDVLAGKKNNCDGDGRQSLLFLR